MSTPNDGPSHGQHMEEAGDPEEPVADLTREDVERMIAAATLQAQQHLIEKIRFVARFTPSREVRVALYSLADQI